jgi:MFS superfamily sulfate permease-like transporter
MSPSTKPKSQLGQMIMLIAIGLFAFYRVAQSPRFDRFPRVDIVLMVATGLCFGVALSLFMRRFKE